MKTLLLLATLSAADPAAAADAPRATAAERAAEATAETTSAAGPDLVLHVPRADVDKLSLDVENLEARLDLDTRVSSLVQVSAGIVANVGKLKMEMEKVSAETHLVVRLERVSDVLQRALAVLDAHPEAGGTPVAAAPRRAHPPVPVALRADGAAPPAAVVPAAVTATTPAAVAAPVPPAAAPAAPVPTALSVPAAPAPAAVPAAAAPASQP